MLGLEHVERLAAEHRADCACAHALRGPGTSGWCRWSPPRRARRELAIRPQLDADRDLQSLRVLHAGRRIPAASEYARSASISLCDSLRAALPVGGAERRRRLSVSAAAASCAAARACRAAPRPGWRRTWAAGRLLRPACSRAFSACAFLASAFFFASSFFKVPRSDRPWAAPSCRALVRRRSGLVRRRPAAALAALTSACPIPFGDGSSGRLFSSATFSTSGFGVSAFGAFFTPLVSSENSLSEMISTGSAVGRLGLERPRGKRDQPPQQQGCVHDAEIVRPVFISGNFTGLAPPP